jgi:hypothetical protein
MKMNRPFNRIRQYCAKHNERSEYPTVLDRMEENSCKQSARWQHLSWFKASAFFPFAKQIYLLRNATAYTGD